MRVGYVGWEKAGGERWYTVQHREPVYVVVSCANNLNKFYSTPAVPNKRILMFMTEV